MMKMASVVPLPGMKPKEGKTYQKKAWLYYTADRIVVNAELLTCTDCGTDIITELLNCFANILLMNYSTLKSETGSRSK